jgi:hypothetical protein
MARQLFLRVNVSGISEQWGACDASVGTRGGADHGRGGREHATNEQTESRVLLVM